MRVPSITRRFASNGLARIVSRLMVVTVAGVGLTACVTHDPNYRAHSHYGYGYGSGSHVVVHKRHPGVVYHRHDAYPRGVPYSRHRMPHHSYHGVVPRPHGKAASRPHRKADRATHRPRPHVHGTASPRPRPGIRPPSRPGAQRPAVRRDAAGRGGPGNHRGGFRR